jgi:Predicted integral membrane protein
MSFAGRIAKLATVDMRIRWFAVLAWMLVIFAFSHQPYSGRESEKVLHDFNVPVRKAGHVTEYLVLFLLIRWAIDGSREKSSRKKVQNENASKEKSASESGARFLPLAAIAFFATALYAGLDEWHQSYVAGRSSSWSDVGVDTCGIILGLALWAGIISSFLNRNDHSDSEQQP